MTAVSVQTHGIRGYASVFGTKDSAATIVDRGAFARSLRGPRPKLGYGHCLIRNALGTSLPIGVITALREDARGLYYEARLHDTQAARDVLACVAGGSMTGASFAFDVESADGATDRSGTLHLTRLDLLELGPVVFPSNPLATCEVFDLPVASTPPVPATDATEEQQLHDLLVWAAKEIHR
jgi:HK97 family phage prohead protease